MRHIGLVMILACLCALATTGCGNGKRDQAPQALLASSELFTDRDLSGTYEASGAEEILLSQGDVTIAREGVYHISGSLTEGMIVVDADKAAKVQLVLDGVEISNSANAAIYVKEADKVFVTLAEGSENSLTSGGYTALDGNDIDGVIFAKSDLTVNGTGKLWVSAAQGHGIVSKDDLKITGGQITVTAAEKGLSGKDSVRVAGGTLCITSGKDGIQGGQNGLDSEKGYIYIAGGDFHISAGGGAEGETVLDGDGNTVDAKGIKASGELRIDAGTIEVDARDDALHSNQSVVINGGALELSSGDDGIHGDGDVCIAGGDVHIPASSEGIEGCNVEISGGNIRLYATDDGVNAAGEGRDHALRITGGTVYVHSGGDGLDSNGSLTVSGGAVYVSGSENGANSALDYETTAQITGGSVIAVGNRTMAMNFGSASTQGAILAGTAEHGAGTTVTLLDSDGAELLSYSSEGAFNSVVVSCPQLVLGGAYTITAGQERLEVSLSDGLIWGVGFENGGFGGHMPGGRFRGDFQEGERPELPEGDMPGRDFEGRERPELPEGDMPGRDFEGRERPGLPEGDFSGREFPERTE